MPTAPPGPGENQSYAEMVRLAQKAGFTNSEAAIAASIAMAESGGNPTATNKNSNGSMDYGLWQINSVHGRILLSGNWWEPEDNAKMAHQVYRNAGSSFKPWVTYNSGVYKQHLKKDAAGRDPELPAEEGGADLGGDGRPFASVPNPLSGLERFGEVLHYLLDPVFWRRFGYGLLGFLLILIAAAFIISSTKTGKRAVKTVGGAVVGGPAGAAVGASS